jgi:hypothetical protein
MQQIVMLEMAVSLLLLLLLLLGQLARAGAGVGVDTAAAAARSAKVAAQGLILGRIGLLMAAPILMRTVIMRLAMKWRRRMSQSLRRSLRARVSIQRSTFVDQ